MKRKTAIFLAVLFCAVALMPSCGNETPEESITYRDISELTSARERLRMTENKVQSVEEKMEEIRLINRAKWLLISELKMSEPDAHRYIEKQAMDRCVSKRVIAEEIVKTYS